MNDEILDKFIANAKRIGLCREYTLKVDKAMSRKAFMDIALDSNGLSYVSEAIAHHEMLSASYIAREFAPFNNGRYVRDKDGYSSSMYCCPETLPVIQTTAALIVSHRGRVVVDKPLSVLYIVDSEIELVGDGRCILYLYNSEITNSNAKAIVKENNKYD